jgi:hypothetical protein
MRAAAKSARRPFPESEPWLARVNSGLVLTCLLFVAIFSLAAVPPLDPDLWWHLANGRLMVGTLAIPHVDVYSFSAAGQPWIVHEWLADLGMYGLYGLGGFPLLVAVFAAMATAAAGCLFWLLRRSGLQATVAVIMTLVGALAGSTAWGARPQLLNPLLTGLLLIGLVIYRDGRLRAWLLPPFIWLWANLHSGFMVGLIISALFLAAEAFDSWRRARGSMPRHRIKALGTAVAASAVLSLVNPFGLQTVLFSLGTLTSPLIQNNIQEWASPDFHSLAGLMLEAILFITLAGLATRRVTPRTSEGLLAFALLYLALSSQRHVPLFVLAAAPLYGRCGQALLDTVAAAARANPGGVRTRRVFRPSARKTSTTIRLGVMNLALLLAVAIGMVWYRAVPNLNPGKEAASIQNALPVTATNALARLGKPIRVFNYYDYGGYLVWRLFPEGGRVFIDGRVEVYGPSIFADYLRVNNLAAAWPDVIERARPDAIVLPSSHPLVRLLQQDPEWQQFSHDGVATVFTRVGFAP